MSNAKIKDGSLDKNAALIKAQSVIVTSLLLALGVLLLLLCSPHQQLDLLPIFVVICENYSNKIEYCKLDFFTVIKPHIYPRRAVLH